MADRYLYTRDYNERDEERWRPGSHWGEPRSYSSDREYGDRDYGWRTERVSNYSGMAEGGHGRPVSAPGRYIEYGRDAYGGPYGRERYGAREWSSTEGWRVPGPYAGRGPRGYQRSDDRIREEINERLTAHGLIDATDVECQVVNGEVTLTGFVDSRGAKRAAEDLAEDVYGVRDVHNQLRVRSHAGDEGVGRTSVLGITETQTQTTHPGPRQPRPRT